MDAFRTIMRGWVGKTLLAIIILPFAVVGIEGVFRGVGHNKPALKINDHEISKAELDQAIENRRQQFLERLGQGVDPSMVTAEMVRPATEKGLIQRQLLIDAAKDQGLAVPQENVKSYIRSLPQFHDEKGAFSQEKLQRFLSQSGMSASRILNEVSTDMLTEQFQSGISQSAFATPQDVNRVLELDKQTRDIDVAIIKPESFLASISLSDDELNQYYSLHQDQFRSEEKVQVEYLHFAQSDFVDNAADVTPEQIRAKTEEKAEKSKQTERRRAEHILFEVGSKHSDAEAKALAESTLADIKAGKSFEEIAKAKSEDFASAKKGGDLGFAGKGDYDPAFEKALYALASPNDISDIVKSEFGYHIIKLVAIDSPKVPDPTKDRDALVKEIKQDQAKERMTTAVDDLNRLAFESGDLSVIADQYKKKVEVSDWITRTQSEGMFGEPKVRDAAFSDAVVQEQRNSDVIELEDGTLVLLRLKTHEVPRQLSLEEVKGKITELTKKEKARDLANKQAADLLANLNKGDDRVAVLKAANLVWESNTAVERTAAKPARPVVQKAFEMAKPEQGKRTNATLNLPSGEIALISIANVSPGKTERTDAEKASFQKGIAMRYGSMDMEGFLSTLESKATIERNHTDETK